MDKEDNTTNTPTPEDELLFPRTPAEREAKAIHEAELAAAKLLATYPTAIPDILARNWLTREEAAKALNKSERTIDRLLKVRKLVRQGEGLPVKITKDSVDRIAGADALVTRRAPTIIIEQASYDALLLHKDRLEMQLRDKETRLLAWEGTISELETAKAELVEQLERERLESEKIAAELETERQARQDVEAVAEQERQERERIAAELATEKSRGFWSRLFGKGE